ncbi:flavin reductase family protein [Aestuariivirga litoralis]|nr:flavin reductase family protein [Aestuariivirga litoralis]
MAAGLRYSETGEGEAVLCLGHDGQALAATHRVIAVDITSGGPVNGLRHLIEDLGITAANIVARGAGAGLALAFAAAHPQNVLRLALVAPARLTEDTILCPVLILGEAEVPASMPRARVEGASDIDAQLASFLTRRLSGFDNRELRSAFGSFMTGVTIVTTTGVDGGPRGFTANSFTSVSLEPPLLMICIGKQAASMETFRRARGFAVNILSEAQKDTSVLFASKRHDKFEAASWRPGPFGNPLIEGSAAWFDCARYQVIDAGDHIILMGHIEAFSYSDANPLGYARGHYITLGLEQAAVNAASSASRTVVGAILENDNRLVLLPDPSRPSGLALPEVGRLGPSGSASQLHDLLQREGLDATLGFLFAVFENPGTREQCIYYRGEALLHARGRTVLADFEDIPWDRLPDEATRSMLRRYAAERKIGRFKVYSGDHRQGTVKAVD